MPVAYDLPIEDAAWTIARKILGRERGQDDAAVLAVRAVTTAGSKRLWIGGAAPAGSIRHAAKDRDIGMDGPGDEDDAISRARSN